MTINRFQGRLVGLSEQPPRVDLQVDPWVLSELSGMGQLDLEIEIPAKPGLMLPASLSASAALKFEMCEAGYRADYIDRTPQLGNSAGDLGSAVHEALQFWIESGQHLQFDSADIPTKNKAMAVVWEMAYWNWFHDKSRYQEGYEMLLKWIQRTHFHDRTVMEVEVKKSFDIQTSKGLLKFNYILDRKDRLATGDIEVVDYKSWMRPLQPSDLPDKIQPRAYGLAMMIEHRDENLPGVWVTLDQLRYDSVSHYFTREECAETYRYLQALAERIYQSEGVIETLNAECRFCSRKTFCKTLLKHNAAGGVVGLGSLTEASEKLLELEAAKGGIDSAIAEVKEQALVMAEAEGELEWDTPTFKGRVTAKGRREVDSGRIAEIVGPAIMARYGNLNVGIVEKILKEETTLTDTQKSQIRQYITKTWGAAYVEIKPKTNFKDE